MEWGRELMGGSEITDRVSVSLLAVFILMFPMI